MTLGTTRAADGVARPPGPADPASEQVRRWIETPVEFWEECARRYGPVVSLDLGSLGPVILLADPESVRQVFRLPAESFECRQYNEHYRYVMGDNAVLLQDGERHQRQRRQLGPAFHPDQLLPLAPAIHEITRKAVSTWPAGQAFNPRPTLHDVAFRVILQLILGTADSSTGRALVAAYQRAVLQQVGSWGPWRSFTRLQPRIRTLLAEEIRTRRAQPEAPGLLTRLAQGRDADGTPATNAQCEDQVFAMMIAGVDTVAIALAWALHWLAREPRVLDRLTDELATVREADGRALLALPYLDAVHDETLRMYPIVPTPSGRRLLRDAVVGEHTFPAGTTLVPCPYLVHRREELYPQGDRFVPERFTDRRYERHEYFPFGGGVRRCVGEALAGLEFKVALAAILERWVVEPLDQPPLPPVRYGTLLAPADSFHLHVRRRAPAPAAGAVA